MSSAVIGIQGSRSSPIRRRPPAEMILIREAVREIRINDNPMTVRQVFYQAVSGVIDMTESECKQTIVRLFTGILLRSIGLEQIAHRVYPFPKNP